MGRGRSALPRHRNPPSGGFRTRQIGVRGLHAGKPAGDVIREGRGLAGRHVDVERHVLGSRRNPAFVGVEELLEKVHAFGVVVDELERHPHGVAGMELAQIAHVHLGGEAGLLARLDVIEAAADELESLVHRAVEQHVVIGHVEMAVVVDPAGLDPHQRGHKGGEEYGFEIAAVQHGATLRWAAQRRPPPESTCESPILSPPPAVLSFPRNSASLRAFTPVHSPPFRYGLWTRANALMLGNPYSRGRWSWVPATGSPRRQRSGVSLAGTTAGKTERSD